MAPITRGHGGSGPQALAAHNSLDGDAGNRHLRASTAARGALQRDFDYQVDPTALVGIAAGYTDSDFSVDDRRTSGTVEGAHFGLYGVKTFGPLYSGRHRSSMPGSKTMTVRDIIINVPPLRLSKNVPRVNSRATFTARKLEAGWKKRYYDGMNVTPFLGLDVAHLSSDGYVEDSVDTEAPGVSGPDV